MDLSCFPRGIQLTDTFPRLSSHWVSARNRFPNVFATISKIIPAHEIFPRSDPVAIILKAELAFVSRQILFDGGGGRGATMKLRFPPNQIFEKARIPAVRPIIPDVYKVGQDPITRLTMPTPSRNLS